MVQSEDRKSFKPVFFLLWLSSRERNFLRRWKADFFTLGGLVEDEDEDPEPGVLNEIDLGVLQGVLSLLADLGAIMLALLAV